jgi:general secretion pathway protein E
MAQRLVRTLCPHCKRAEPLGSEDEILWRGLVSPWKARKPAQLHRSVGCLECRMTGYLGRVGLYEIMPMTHEIKAMIGAHTDLAALRERAIKAGMQPLRIAGARKVAAGLTTIEEVLKVAPPLQD